MTTYLYGLILARNAERVPPAAKGIAGAAVRVLHCVGGRIAGLVSTLDEPIQASIDAVRAHDRALQSAVDHDVTVAAVRFRQSFSTDDEVCRHLSEHGGRVAELLDHLDGFVEMRILAAANVQAPRTSAPSQPEYAAAGPGVAYLQQLRDKSAQRPAYSARTELAALIRDEHVTSIREDAVAVAHLVRRSDIPAYKTAVATIPRFSQATVVGPFALYSFAEPGT